MEDVRFPNEYDYTDEDLERRIRWLETTNENQLNEFSLRPLYEERDRRNE